MSNNHVKWTKAMNRYVFKKLFELMGPLSSYVNKKGSSEKERKAFDIIAKDLTEIFSQEVTQEKVVMHVYKVSMIPILNPRSSIILKLAAAIESGWMCNDDILRMEKYYVEKGMMIDLGNYYAIKKA